MGIGSESQLELTEFLVDGFDPGDLPGLFPLLQARTNLNAFRTLFHGAEAGVLVRLLVLREIGSRSEEPTWSAQELRTHFSYL